MKFLECQYFTKTPLLVFISSMILWISSLFPNQYINQLTRDDRKVVSCHLRGGTKCRDLGSISDSNKSSRHPLEKGDPSLNTVNSLQPLFNST